MIIIQGSGERGETLSISAAYLLLYSNDLPINQEQLSRLDLRVGHKVSSRSHSAIARKQMFCLAVVVAHSRQPDSVHPAARRHICPVYLALDCSRSGAFTARQTITREGEVPLN